MPLFVGSLAIILLSCWLHFPGDSCRLLVLYQFVLPSCKGVGTGGDGGDVSPPIFETGAFVPPKNYTAKYIYIFFIFYSLLF